VAWSQVGFTGSATVTDLWSGASVGTVSDSYSATLRPGETRLIRARPTSAAVVRYQAENATIATGTVDTNHIGFTGTGFANVDNVTGGYVEWTVNAASTGNHALRLRYANGTTTGRPATISVNGTTVASNVAFNGTGSWDTWATATVTAALTAGTNTVRATATTAVGPPNLDYLEVEPQQTSTRYEAENAVCRGTVDSDHTGFSGTGFCNTTNEVGSYVEWTVTAGQAGTARLTIRYANGTTTNRPMDVSVNGGAPTSVAFPGTGSWDTWATASVTVALVAGTNTIRATATTATGGPNVDYLDVTAG
jgi:hypothetical protein